jgi:serine/threonine protein kinase
MSESDFTPYGYQIIERLGQNIYGGRVTYKAINVNDRQPVVIKQFQFANDSNWEDYKAIEQEINILQKLDFPGIQRYLGHFDSGNGICLVQEYKNAQPLSIQSSFNFDEIKHIAISILEILVYLQNRNLPVIHRDIKPENILVDEQLNIYLVDFGFSKMGEGSVALSSVVAGTFGFMPPEQLHNLQLTKASDLYSLGATLICLITKTKSTQIGKLIDLSNNRLQFQHRMSGFSVEFVQWLEQMVQLDPNRRFPNANEALKVLQSLHITRSPEVKLSQCELKFGATRLIEKLTRTIVIENSVPETILEGHLQVAADSKDPPHTPGTHAWIAISPKNFKTNRVQCQIKVDTSKLKANSVYKRWILLHTNAALDPFKIQVQVHTASIPKETSTSSTIPKFPYVSLLLLLIPAFVTTVAFLKVNTVFGNLLGDIFDALSRDGAVGLFGGLLFGLLFGLLGGLIGTGVG